MVLESENIGGEEEGGKTGTETQKEICWTGPMGRRGWWLLGTLRPLRLCLEPDPQPQASTHQPLDAASGSVWWWGPGVCVCELSCR